MCGQLPGISQDPAHRWSHHEHGYVRATAANRGGGDPLQPVGRAPDAQRASIQDVGVDHRRPDIVVAEQFLNRPDVVPHLQQVGGKGMAQRVGGGVLVIPAALMAAFTARCKTVSWR